jgi:hypothetical protein
MTRKSFPFRSTGGEVRDLAQPGYYAGYSTLAQKKHWDEATRRVVEQRVNGNSCITFFSQDEAAIIGAVVDRVIPQDDRDEEHTIPIVGVLDERLAKNSLNGFRYEDMPPDQEAYKLAIKAIDEMAQARLQEPFIDLTVQGQELILKSLHDGKPDPEHAAWKQMPVHRFWGMLMEDCLTAYYSHPWAWDEIGFGGPAYPRGYMRLENGLPEPWEKDEQRYEWNAPADSLSELVDEGTPPEYGSLHGHGGRYLMAQAGNVVAGRFEELIRLYKAPPAQALSEEFYETDSRRGFARGFAIQTVGPLPVAFAKQMVAAMGAWGWGMRRVMMDYNHWATLGVLGEILPWEDNRVELAEEKDQYGLRVAKVTFNLHDNDLKLIEFGKNKVVEIMWAAGATQVVQESRFAHLVGGVRMGSDPANSVVNKFGRTHDIPNLFVCDGSILPTQGSANPGLTIQALAARTADYLIKQGDAIFTSSEKDMSEPGIRYDLSPPYTKFKGNPRIA